MRPTRVLLVEDSDDDEKLIRRELNRDESKAEITRVRTRDELQTALNEREWDIVISDHSMPDLRTEEVVSEARRHELPVILLSGALPESSAAHYLSIGCRDFLEKSRLDRLRAVVHREVQDHSQRIETRKIRGWFEMMLEGLPVVGYICRPDKGYAIQYMTANAQAVTGYAAEEFTRDAGLWPSRIHPEDAERVFEQMERLRTTETASIEYRWQRRDGAWRWFGDTLRLVSNAAGQPLHIVGLWKDMDDRKRSELEIRRLNTELESRVAERTQNLAEANERLRQANALAEERRRRSEQLAELFEYFNACSRVEEVYELVGIHLPSIVPGATSRLFVARDRTDFMEPAFTTGGAGAEPLRRADCWALRRNRVHRVVDARDTVTCRHCSPGPCICVPVLALGETVGLLEVRAGPDDRGPTVQVQQDTAVVLAEHIGVAIGRLKLLERLGEQSLRDPLTGLFNRRHLEDTLRIEIARAGKSGAPVAVAMLDIDHFKPFNDTHGHAGGDEALRSVAQLISRQVRSVDTVCRFGGEEFVIILPGTAPDVAHERLERIRRAIGDLPITLCDGTPARVTASVGLASSEHHGRTPETLLASADAALYAAKREGRNRTAVAPIAEGGAADATPKPAAAGR